MIYRHGGDVETIAREAGISPGGLLDFSSNVNPLGLPPRAAERLAREARDPTAWSRYPDPQFRELRSAIQNYVHVPGESIVIGAGADCLIHAAVRALAPERCWIPVPAFSEYERASNAFGSETRQCDSIAVALEHAKPGDLVAINNPRNPTGACLDRSRMLDHLGAARARNLSVLVDEAFIDYAPDASITPDAAARPRIIAIRSLTKFFGCPGLRAGYAIAAPETASKLAAQLPPWPVTTLAANTLAEALQESEYRERTRETNGRARAGLSTDLSSLGCDVLPSAANFVLLRLPANSHASDVRALLIRRHSILVRECDTFSGLEPGRYLRVAVRTESENEQLTRALAGILHERSCLQTQT